MEALCALTAAARRCWHWKDFDIFMARLGGMA
jgi:hypothetical protein